MANAYTAQNPIMSSNYPQTYNTDTPGIQRPYRERLEYELKVRQEPKQARMCGVGADRRPIDPPPIIQLRVIDPQTRQPPSPAHTDPDDADPNYAHSFLQNPYYFMFASLAKPDDDAELHWLKDGKTRCTTGSVVSSLYHLKDTENRNEDAGFFVFPDLSVRTEGSYRLKLSLFEVVGNNVTHCKSIYSAPFYVYTAKKFPGMEESTALSCSLADQGIKIRIRKDIRVRKRPIAALSAPISDEEPPSATSTHHPPSATSLHAPHNAALTKKRQRHGTVSSGTAEEGSVSLAGLPAWPAASLDPMLGVASAPGGVELPGTPHSLSGVVAHPPPGSAYEGSRPPPTQGIPPPPGAQIIPPPAGAAYEGSRPSGTSMPSSQPMASPAPQVATYDSQGRPYERPAYDAPRSSYEQPRGSYDNGRAYEPTPRGAYESTSTRPPYEQRVSYENQRSAYASAYEAPPPPPQQQQPYQDSHHGHYAPPANYQAPHPQQQHPSPPHQYAQQQTSPTPHQAPQYPSPPRHYGQAASAPAPAPAQSYGPPSQSSVSYSQSQSRYEYPAQQSYAGNGGANGYYDAPAPAPASTHSGPPPPPHSHQQQPYYAPTPPSSHAPPQHQQHQPSSWGAPPPAPAHSHSQTYTSNPAPPHPAHYDYPTQPSYGSSGNGEYYPPSNSHPHSSARTASPGPSPPANRYGYTSTANGNGYPRQQQQQQTYSSSGAYNAAPPSSVGEWSGSGPNSGWSSGSQQQEMIHLAPLRHAHPSSSTSSNPSSPALPSAVNGSGGYPVIQLSRAPFEQEGVGRIIGGKKNVLSIGSIISDGA
ncbi:velvet factor-domain-containing protein [Hygrophoropsis aurantiaca]|uniref:Velvet factor-domain-containing protein n=1 Tax=Hygrophoropsis aurantiaca TaxID=72124 RepID=A0ACB8A1A7_9AGAM|nr:velvet factor-domain-containing protein [Hygrophoropsis aurantiaca]